MDKFGVLFRDLRACIVKNDVKSLGHKKSKKGRAFSVRLFQGLGYFLTVFSGPKSGKQEWFGRPVLGTE